MLLILGCDECGVIDMTGYYNTVKILFLDNVCFL